MLQQRLPCVFVLRRTQRVDKKETMAEKDDNLSLPKGMLFFVVCSLFIVVSLSLCCATATVSKLIKEMLPEDVKCSNDTRDLILECCVGMVLFCCKYNFIYIVLIFFKKLKFKTLHNLTTTTNLHICRIHSLDFFRS